MQAPRLGPLVDPERTEEFRRERNREATEKGGPAYTGSIQHHFPRYPFA